MVARRSPSGKTKRRLDTDEEVEEGYQGPQDGATSTSISVTAPAMEQASFDSWAEFQTSLERYQAETYQQSVAIGIVMQSSHMRRMFASFPEV
ncbi:hypothetical protein PF002_g11792 [Phytophthora fragariae]|uniref:Uncharacterized protein n=1 Tax=Phytophthora fragariae TaxID=53985 RepID=A0A6A3ZFL7_9STRA|nr:hypothetical protein PF002_g11792 [Phytophthora fragariae]